MTATPTGPLAGVRVLELAALGPSPFAAMLLSDMGADVVRIDRKGSTLVPGFAILERGRRSVVLDLKSAQGLATALAMVARTDILLEGYRPGVMERLGLGPDEALRHNPRLVYGRMTGWGQDGPYATMAGHDMNYVALSGALHMIGPKERPVMPLNLIGDFGGGGAYLTIGVLAALTHARATGVGQVVDATMVDGVVSLMSGVYGARAHGGLIDEREANIANGSAPFMNIYECSDGGFITLCAYEPQFYRLMLEKLGLADDPLFAEQNDPDIWAEQKLRIAKVVAGATRQQWCERLEGTDACFAPVLTMGEAPHHPHNVARGTFVEADGMVQPAPAPRFSVTPSQIRGPQRPAGGDQNEVFAEWGIDQP